MQRHLQIAQEQGPKAGLTFYLNQSAPTAQANRDKINSAKDPLSAYCALFSTHFAPLSANGASVQTSRTKDERQGLIERLAAFLQGEGLTEEVGVQVVADEAPAKPKRTRSPKGSSKPTTTLSVGDSFTYNGKSEWEILRVKGQRYIATNGRRESAWKITTVDKLLADGKIVKA